MERSVGSRVGPANPGLRLSPRPRSSVHVRRRLSGLNDAPTGESRRPNAPRGAAARRRRGPGPPPRVPPQGKYPTPRPARLGGGGEADRVDLTIEASFEPRARSRWLYRPPCVSGAVGLKEGVPGGWVPSRFLAGPPRLDPRPGDLATLRVARDQSKGKDLGRRRSEGRKEGGRAVGRGRRDTEDREGKRGEMR